MKRIRIIVTGNVTGVFFRDNTKKQAVKLGLVGYVKNLEGGGVEVVAQGDEEALQELVKYCHSGPQFARVESVKVEELESADEFNSFEVEY